MPDGAHPSDGRLHVLELSPLTLDRLAEVRAFLRDALAALEAPGAVDALVMAVDEVCANLVQHAPPGTTPGPSRVSVRRDADRVIVEVEDRGHPFDPADAPPPDLDAPWEERRVGGLGWFLVRQMVDDLRYESHQADDGPFNRLTLTRRAAA